MVGASHTQEQQGLLEPGAWRQHAIDWGAPIVATFLATAIRIAMAGMVGSAVPFITYFVATLILAWFRGFWPAALNVALSVLAGAYFVLPTAGTERFPWGKSENAAIAGFAGASLVVSILLDSQRRTLIRARKAEQSQAAIARQNADLLAQARRSEDELRITNEGLRRANRDLEMFAYSASHDLREPLRTINISAELIERKVGGQLQGIEAEFLSHLKAATRRMDVLLQDLLTYSRATKIANGPSPAVDASQVLADVLASLRGQIDSAGAIITAEALPTVEIHESSLAQIFQNLINNAVKYRRKEIPRVHIRAQEQNGDCIFSVADNGLGIDREYRDQIFGLFKRLHGHDEYPGSGMGLAISKRVVEQYGGSIWLEQSEPGRGSTFCFSIPRSTT
jgi:signal transduction histidine kinase